MVTGRKDSLRASVALDEALSQKPGPVQEATNGGQLCVLCVDMHVCDHMGQCPAKSPL